MPRIKNKLFQPLSILLAGEKTLYLRSRETAELSASDMDSSHLQSLIKAGQVALVEAGKETSPVGRSRRRDE